MTDLFITELERKQDSRASVDDDASTILSAEPIFGMPPKMTTDACGEGGNSCKPWDGPNPFLPGIDIVNIGRHIDTLTNTPSGADKIELNIEAKEIAREIVNHKDGKFSEGAEREFIEKSLKEAANKGKKYVDHLVQQINEGFAAADSNYMIASVYPEEKNSGLRVDGKAEFMLYDLKTRKETDRLSIPVQIEGPIKFHERPFLKDWDNP